jgi:phosphate transport system protein
MLRYIDGRHASAQYEEDLRAVIYRLNEMRALVQSQFTLLEGLIGEENPDPEAKTSARQIDAEIGTLQNQVEQDVYEIISKYTPQSQGLRIVLNILKLASHIERMGDHCKNSIKRLLHSHEKMSGKVHKHVERLVAATAVIVYSLEETILHFPDDKAARMLEADDAVDEEYQKLIFKFPKMIDKDKIDHNAVADVLFIAKNMERLADHGTDILRELYYVHHGKRMELD